MTADRKRPFWTQTGFARRGTGELMLAGDYTRNSFKQCNDTFSRTVK